MRNEYDDNTGQKRKDRGAGVGWPDDNATPGRLHVKIISHVVLFVLVVRRVTSRVLWRL